ncbi:hypothetical protein ABEB36_014501 [Hypothenemus hampei]|uniref:DDE Tnp4 domain-containing protein n=1 Tax=Hypothenemus hampei TaxID=57062 RepID=A0ABD1E422_HYPHA
MNNLTLNYFSWDFFFEDSFIKQVETHLLHEDARKVHVVLQVLKSLKNPYHQYVIMDFDNDILNHYNELVFFQIFRMRKETFEKLLKVILENDVHHLIKRKYRGGNYPVHPEKGLLIFIWYLSKPDALNTISEAFRVLPSTVMRVVNAFLYIIKSLKQKYIFWPRTEQEFEDVARGFNRYPGTIGAVDGCHINIKVPVNQHDSYADRYLQHSMNLMAICNAKKIFTYIFVGFPGSAHDSRVFSNSLFVRNIEQHGKEIYFPHDYHIIGDSAFPLSSWLMKPYSNARTDIQRNHNYVLSAERICIEHTFGLLLGRWRRLQFINTYSISKSVEIIVAACILHNFCYLNNDLWNGEVFVVNNNDEPYDRIIDVNLARIKRDRIAENL